MERKPEDKRGVGRGTKEWLARLAADLAADGEAERWRWGDIDERTLAHYDAGKYTP
jgi:hypothetical protein